MNLLHGNDAMSMLIDIYLDGFTTGAASMLATFSPDAPEEKRDQLVDEFTECITRDPLMLDAIRREISERMTGVDTGPKNATLHIPESENPR